LDVGMLFKYFWYLKDLSLVLLSCVLLVLSFPSFDLGLFAWVGLVPFLIVINGKTSLYSFFFSFVCGVLFFLGTFLWILEVVKFMPLHHVTLLIYTGSYFGFFGLMFAFISRRWGIAPAFLAAPFLWVSLEYVRANFFFLALPWALLAHSQYQYPWIIQFASITGAYGISFLVVMVNSAFTLAILALLSRVRWYRLPASQVLSRREMIATVFPAVVLATLALLYGQITLSRPLVGKKVRISVVQGNIEQAKKWDRKYAKFIMQTYADLTREVAEDQPDLIIWPETATPRAINRDPKLFNEVKDIAKSAGTYLLVGSSQLHKFKVGDPKSAKYLNSAFLIHPERTTSRSQRYDKIRLFPFGEYLPLKGTIPWAYINVPDIGGYVPGKEFTVFELPPFRFGTTICWEDIFPDLVRQFVKKGAQFIVNITNEAWFGKSAAPYQFVSMSVFRSVENRIFLVRCANTGVSCFIDPYGRIVDRVKDKSGQDIFVRGVLSGSVIPLVSNTFYTRYGDWLAWLSLPCSLIFLAVTFFKKNQYPNSMSRPI